MLKKEFFDRDSEELAVALLGKVLCVKHRVTAAAPSIISSDCGAAPPVTNYSSRREVPRSTARAFCRKKAEEAVWLRAMIIETEAYKLTDKASHASLGSAKKRKALFMEAGTIYMYHSRAGASLNISAHGAGNAVLIKSGIPYSDNASLEEGDVMISYMQKLNPKNDGTPRDPLRLCSGQTLLCKSLGLEIDEWDKEQFDINRFYISDVGYRPKKVLVATRLGIAPHRDAHLPYRFIDAKYNDYCTKKAAGYAPGPSAQSSKQRLMQDANSQRLE